MKNYAIKLSTYSTTEVTELIDFSAKHDTLIRNHDGSLSPMDEPYFWSRKIAEGTWQILSAGDYTYLAEGENEAVVIDSGYGCGNIREYCQSLTKKPISNIINTHHHFDHTANNSYFDVIYASRESIELFPKPNKSFEGIEFPMDYPVKVLEDGDIYDLGGRTLQVIKIPNHAPGSIALLDRKERILFSGDELMYYTRLRVSVEKFAENMRKLKKFRNEFDTLCAGSSLFDAVLVDRLLLNAEFILAGNEGDPMPKTHFSQAEYTEDGRTIIPHRRSPRPMDRGNGSQADAEFMRIMDFDDCLISYDIRKIHEK